MRKFFYTHLVEMEELMSEIKSLKLAEHEEVELTELLHKTLHHTILDTILSELSEEDKHTFLEHLFLEDDEKIWNHLQKTVNDVEDKIRTATKSLVTEMHEDVKELKKR